MPAQSSASSLPSDGKLSPSEIIAQAEEHWNVSGTSVLTAWGLTFVGSIIVLLLFSWRRRKNRLIYLPRVRACQKRQDDYHPEGTFVPPVPVLEPGFLAWLKPSWRDFLIEIRPCGGRVVEQRDIALLQLLGLDAVTYLQFLRLLRWLFTATCVLVSLPLTCADYYINTSTQYGSLKKDANAAGGGGDDSDSSSSSNMLDNMQLFTAANIKGNGLYVQILFEWVVTCLVIVFVSSHSRHHEKLVREWTNMNWNEVAFKTIMVTNLNIPSTIKRTAPNGTTYKQARYVLDIKQEVCGLIGPGELRLGRNCEVTLTHRNMGHLAHMIEEYHKKDFKKFDRSLTKWLRRHREGGAGKDYDEWYHRFGCCGKSRTTAHRIEVAQTKKVEIERRQAEAQDNPEMEDILPIAGTTTSAFITVSSAKRAHELITLSLKKKYLKKAEIHVQRAPRPENIIWKNLEQDPKTRRSHSRWGMGILVVVCFLNTIPLMAITVLANLDVAIQQVPWLKKLEHSSEAWEAFFDLIDGILPASIGALCSYVLPHIMRIISRWSGAITRGQLDQNVIRQLFIFLLVSQFVVFSLLGLFYEEYLTVKKEIGHKSFKVIYQSMGDIPAKVTKAYITESSYWLSWYPIRAAVAFIELLQLPAIFLKIWQIIFFARTGKEVDEMSQPRPFEMFAMVVALMYAPLAPLVPACGSIYFWSVSVVHLNQLKYVEDTKKETDGKVWKVVLNRLLAAVVLMQLLMIATIALKTKSSRMTAVAAIPVTFIALLKWHVDRFKTTAQIIASHGEIPDDPNVPVPKFQHTLLRKDWMPTFRLMPQDQEEYEKAKDDPVFGKTLRRLLYGNSGTKKKRHHKRSLKKYLGSRYKKEERSGSRGRTGYGNRKTGRKRSDGGDYLEKGEVSAEKLAEAYSEKHDGWNEKRPY